ncbi:MAG: hypothetical protein HPY54_13640 [Chthonomonadetes bacterium]|nr:hypothetical protein [Chthonomonadetes bacterium]
MLYRKAAFGYLLRVVLILCAAVLLDMVIVLFPVRVWAAIPNTCEVACKDINDCGCIPFYSNNQLVDCLLGCNETRTVETWECCGAGKMGFTRQRFYDCNNDGRTDCECKFKTWIHDQDCYSL